MPIKGLSEKRRLPRLGKIHLGFKDHTPKGVEFPRATDYFICPPEVQTIFGDKPKEMRIMIPLEDEERWASQYYRCYSKTRGLICKGDGEVATRMVDVVTGAMADRDSKEVEMRDVPCLGRECPDYNVKCREVMNLQFLLPEVRGLGIWQIDTSSINSIKNINSCADFIRAVYGRIALLPLLLRLEPAEVSGPDGKKKAVHILNLHTNSTMIDLMKASLKPPPQLIAGIKPQEVSLPVPDDERPDLISPEFEPDVVDLPPMEPVTIDELWPEDKRGAPSDSVLAPESDEGCGIDLVWLNESLERLHWQEVTFKTYLRKFGVDTKGSIPDIIGQLTPEQKQEVVREIEERLTIQAA